jgi:proteasome-associated ATPase
MTSDEEKSWKEKALEAIEVLKKISQPPLQYATVVGIDGKENGTLDISLGNGSNYVVFYDTRLKSKLAVGQTVRVSPESFAVVGIEGNMRTRCSATVKDLLDDGRVQIEAKGDKKVIQTAVQGVKVGDNVLVDQSYSVVVENLGNHTKAYKLEQVPEVPWTAIGGLEKVITEIKRTVELPLAHKELFAKFPGKKPVKGVLLYGPPGCGKTQIGKAIAQEALAEKQRTIMTMKCPENPPAPFVAITAMMSYKTHQEQARQEKRKQAMLN